MTATVQPKMTSTTAYHEAGHIVAAWVQGIGVGSATVVRNGDIAGSVTLVDSDQRILVSLDEAGAWKHRMRVEKEIIVCVSGPLAQRKFSPRSMRRWHGAGDYEAAVNWASSICGSGKQIGAFITWLETRAETLLDHGWPAVCAVAEGLMRSGTLTQNEIEALLARPLIGQAD